MKRTISVFLALLLCIILLGCKGKHHYTPIDIDSYITEDIDFYTENDTYAHDVQRIRCYFTYNGDEEHVYLSDPSSCYLIREQDGKWYKLEFKKTHVEILMSRGCKRGEECSSVIKLGFRYEFPLDAGTYRLLWDNYVSDTFKIEEGK